MVLIVIWFQFHLVNRSAQKYIGGLISMLFFLIGCYSTSIQVGKHNPVHVLNLGEKEIKCLAKVCSSPKINSKTQVQVSLNKIIANGKETKSEGKIISFFPVDAASKQLKYGDKIWLHLNLNEISSSVHPSGFDFKRYYENKGIYHNAHVIDWKLIEKNKGVYSSILDQRKSLLQILNKHLYTENEYAVGAALCLGNKDLLSEELKNEFATVGAMHVLAVSGLHVGIIFSLLLKILSLFKTRKRLWVFLKIAVTILCIWLFAFLTGGSPSVLRAALMFSFITVSF